MAGGIEDTARSNSSRVLTTGNAAVLSRVRALEASRAAISASTRVRNSSSGAHRWVFAVRSSSGASWRIAASLSRRSPSTRSGASARRGRAHDVPTRRWRAGRSPTASGSGPGAARARARPRPWWAGVFRCRRRGWTGRPRPASGRTRPPGPVRRGTLPPCAAARVLSSASSGPSRVFPAAAAPVMNASAVGPSAQNAFSATVFGRTARAAPPAADRRSDRRAATPRPARPACARRPPRPRRGRR